jgi:hypothetical protein
VRAGILALLAVWAVLTSQGALAHGSHEHKAAPAKAQAKAQAAIVATGEVSPLCPPGGTGHVCGCGNLSVCDARSKVAAASVFAGYRPVIVSSDRVALHHRAQPFPRPQFSPASPRAPPSFS